MKCIVELPWKANGELFDRVWKPVEMPCLLPKGSIIFLDDGDDFYLDDMRVEYVTWWEKWPYMVEIALACTDFKDADEDEVLKGMAVLGWTSTFERTWMDAIESGSILW